MQPLSRLSFLENASASYDTLAENGPAVAPLDFGPPYIGDANHVSCPVYNPVKDEILHVKNIVYQRNQDGTPPQRAYWIGRKLQKCIFGVVKSCTILKARDVSSVPFEVTEQKAAVKILSWEKIRRLNHLEDPKKEAAAMQYLCREGHHPHVISVLDVLQDKDYLMLFTNFCSSGDLFGYVQEAGRFKEPMARYWFRQILDGMGHLQSKGICHRDISLENILIDRYHTSVVIDLGMCLRVPFLGDDGGVSDVTSGNLRLLMKPQSPCGKPIYISPEILKSEEPFDGFAVDLFGLGVALFVMLVGLPPWEFAREEDPRYEMIAKGNGLQRLLRSWNRPVSKEAADLMQKMLMEDPRQRLSLLEIKHHPWVKSDTMQDVAMAPEPMEGWRY